jgi:hypothetical protein
MTEYAPQAIKNLFATVQAAIPSALMGGIIGDAAHTYGYHRGRNYVPGDDYSVQSAEDRQGDGEAACGLDISWGNAADHYTVSRRLLDAAHDSRMYPAREFYGSTDGWTVCGYDYPGGYPVTSDPSHLWHVHLSIQRQYANDGAALQGIASVITGGAASAIPPPPLPTSSEDDPMFKIIYGGDQFLLCGGKIVRLGGPADINGPAADAPEWVVSATQWRLLCDTYGAPGS